MLALPNLIELPSVDLLHSGSTDLLISTPVLSVGSLNIPPDGVLKQDQEPSFGSGEVTDQWRQRDHKKRQNRFF